MSLCTLLADVSKKKFFFLPFSSFNFLAFFFYSRATRLKSLLCPSLGSQVRWSVCQSFRRSVGPLVHSQSSRWPFLANFEDGKNHFAILLFFLCTFQNFCQPFSLKVLAQAMLFSCAHCHCHTYPLSFILTAIPIFYQFPIIN